MAGFDPSTEACLVDRRYELGREVADRMTSAALGRGRLSREPHGFPPILPPFHGGYDQIPSDSRRHRPATREHTNSQIAKVLTDTNGNGRTRRANPGMAVRPTAGSLPAAMRCGDAPSGAPRSHPLTTSAPIRAQRGDRREPVRFKRRPLAAAGFGRLRERLQTDAPYAPDCGFSRHRSRCESPASTRPRDRGQPQVA